MLIRNRRAAAAGGPTNTVAPALSGTETEGQTLTAAAGTWKDATATATRQWQRDTDGTGTTWNNISGETGATYVLAAADVGKKVRVVESCSNGAGTKTANSSASGVIAAAQPSIDWQSTETAAGTGATSLAVNKPAGTVSGNLLVLTVHLGSFGAVNTPSGFTLIGTVRGVTNTGNNKRIAFYYRIADGSEGANFTVTWTNAAECILTCSRYTSSGTISLDVQAGSGPVFADGATPAAAPSVITTQNKARVIAGYTTDSLSMSTPTGTTLRASLLSTHGTGSIRQRGHVVDFEKTTAGATGTIVSTPGGGTAVNMITAAFKAV